MAQELPKQDSIALLATAMEIDVALPGELLANTIADQCGHTIVPLTLTSGGQTSAGRARALLTRAAGRSSKALEFGEILGEGGMGIVHSARQEALGRNVAVKTIRPEISSEKTVMAILREAWVTGTLEHPNIVPVYYIDTDDHGKPIIVLKRIEGVVWSSLISDAGAVRQRFGACDLLEWNLGVLEQVINAMRYAHQRGILHRDLKPDNVMIGEFGEVYVLDWGIAVALVDDGETLLPIAHKNLGIAGTPAYMAPEMLGHSVSERTDVYLLGGLLYQVITDFPPHLGSTLDEFVASIKKSSPPFPEKCPASLCAIARKAMSANPEQRFASAEDMGRALQQFSEHRGSRKLSDRALSRLESLRAATEQEASPEALQESFRVCCFGFQSALESWPGNSEAARGLSEATEIMAEAELRRGDPRVAASILRAEKNPAPWLADEVAAAVQVLEKADAYNRELGQRLDKVAGRGTRVVIVAILGSIWIALELWAQLTGYIAEVTLLAMTLGSLAFLAVHLGLLFLGRNTLMRTLTNRQFGVAFSVLLGGQAILSAVGGSIGLTPPQVQVLWILIWTVIAAIIATAIESRLWPMALGIGICFVAASVSIDQLLYAMMASTAIMMINIAAIWWPQASSQSKG